MSDKFKILGFDHVQFLVGNAKQAAFFYQKQYGFEPFAYSGLETGNRQTASYALRQNKIFFVLSSPLDSDHPANEFLTQHGDAVKDIAFTVDDATLAWKTTTDKGAISVMEPTRIEEDKGFIVKASVKTYGNTIHSFIERKNYRGNFLPGYEKFRPVLPANSANLVHIDHIVGNQDDNEMEKTVEFYHHAFNFHRFWTADDKDISTEYSSLRSVVVANDNEIIKMPINEPAPGLRKSQIKEYVEFNKGAGVQHIALSTQNIIDTVRRLKRNGVEFLPIPDSYYETLIERVGNIDEEIEILRELNILVDRDEKGYMLQLFTKPVEDRPTLFMEVIQRKGSNSFGNGNFKALFESIEREQAKRGNL